MPRLCVAICFFIFGYGSALLFKGQSAEPQISDEHRSVFNDAVARRAGNRGVFLGGAIPTFLPLEQTPIFNRLLVDSSPQDLDGLDCRDCTFDNSEVSYNGGAFNLVGVKFSGTTNVKLKGAAANTVAFLDFMKQIGQGVQGVSFPRGKPVEKKTVAKKPMTRMSVTAPFIGPEQ